jgi:hypothetical protein
MTDQGGLTPAQMARVYRAVLEGAGYEQIDALAFGGVALGRAVGEQARAQTLAIITERDTATARLAEVERERDKALAANAHDVVCSADPHPYGCGCLRRARERAEQAEATLTEHKRESAELHAQTVRQLGEKTAALTAREAEALEWQQATEKAQAGADHWTVQAMDFADQLAAREAEVAGLREALERLEWSATDEMDMAGWCPACHCHKTHGHRAQGSGCFLAQALAPPQPAPDTEACRRSAPEVQAHAPAVVDGQRPRDADGGETGGAA